jgi:hypothetical protein
LARSDASLVRSAIFSLEPISGTAIWADTVTISPSVVSIRVSSFLTVARYSETSSCSRLSASAASAASTLTTASLAATEVAAGAVDAPADGSADGAEGRKRRRQ